MEWQRIARRQQLWWGKWQSPWARLHRLRELATPRRVTDPDSSWRCCDRWPRALLNKLNGRVFAERHGCTVPRLVWSGRVVTRLPFDELPARFVIKPSLDAACNGVAVMVDGHDILRDRRLDPDELRRDVLATHGRLAPWPVMVEEFVGDGPELPLEYKCHLFGDTIAAIQVERRFGPKSEEYNFYDAEWRRFREPFRTNFAQGAEVPCPPHLDRLLDQLRRLGRHLDTYMRADFYCTERGWVFSEFSSAPGGGRHFTEFADQFFEGFWREHFPDRS